MAQLWKHVVYEYVRLRNQLEVDQKLDQMNAYIHDTAYIEWLRKRMEQLKERYDRWHNNPQSSETRVKLTQVQEQEGKVIVDLALYRRREIQTQQAEECVDKERLIVVNGADGWQIEKVVVADAERSSTWSNKQVLDPSPSIPYLNQQILVNPASYRSKLVYNRPKVQEYADLWWDRANPDYLHFDVDCSNYVSQCLFAGGAPMNYTGAREKGWWYKGKHQGAELWSFSWAVAHSLQQYLNTTRHGFGADPVESPDQLTIGDVISYDWDGNGKYQHCVIVAALDRHGMPLVNAHTTDSKHRYWDYRDSYAWSEKTQYRFLHIRDIM